MLSVHMPGAVKLPPLQLFELGSSQRQASQYMHVGDLFLWSAIHDGHHDYVSHLYSDLLTAPRLIVPQIWVHGASQCGAEVRQ